MNHTDIRKKSWIEALPAPVRPYLYLARLDRPIGIWLLVLPGWWAIVLAAGGWSGLDAHAWRLIILFGLGAALMRGAGCIINDIWDRDLDREVTRTRIRPLAAGTLTLRQATIFLNVLLLCGLLILLQMNRSTIILGVFAVPLIIIYPLAKRWTWWPQAVLGFTFNFSALMGWSAAAETLAAPAPWLLYAGAVFWTLGYDTVYAHQDMEDDALAGVKSSALRLGERSKVWVIMFYIVFFIFLALSSALATHILRAAFYIVPAALYTFWRLKHWTPSDPQSSLSMFKSSRNTGVLILLGHILLCT